MTFEEYATQLTWRTVAERTKAKAAWEHQQQRIDELERKLELREAFIAGFQFGKQM